MPFAYRVLDYDLAMAINDQKSKIFAEAGIVLTRIHRLIMTVYRLFQRAKRESLKIFFISLKYWKQIKDFDSCAAICKKFMCKYEEEI